MSQEILEVGSGSGLNSAQLGYWLSSGLFSREGHGENDVEKECHNKGDGSNHECALSNAV